MDWGGRIGPKDDAAGCKTDISRDGGPHYVSNSLFLNNQFKYMFGFIRKLT
jgi:hypothetical protein